MVASYLDEQDLLDWDAVLAALRGLVGEWVSVSVKPMPEGTVYATLLGVLSESGEGARWASRDAHTREVASVAFQVGPEPQSYFLLSRDLFTGAGWISRRHKFLVIEHGPVEIGVEATSEENVVAQRKASVDERRRHGWPEPQIPHP
jgi:hypothetical protein